MRARVDVAVLEDVTVYKSAVNVLKTNVAACMAIGDPFASQLGRIFLDLLNLYRAATMLISARLQRDGQYAFTAAVVKVLYLPFLGSSPEPSFWLI